MKGIYYVNLAPALASAALAFSLSPITMPVIATLFDIHTNGHISLEAILGLLVILGWLPGLTIAIIADHMRYHISGSPLKTNLTHVIATLAILFSLSWIVLLIIAPLIS